MDTLLQDLRLAVRSLLRSPGFTTASLLTLTLGIGVNAAVFSIVNGVLLRPLPYPEADSLIRVYETNPGEGLGQISVSVPTFEDWRKQVRSVAAMTAFQSYPMVVSGRGEPIELETTFVLGDFFGTLGTPALIGRALREDDVRQGLPHAMISERLWRTYFTSDPQVIGSVIAFLGQSYTVVGVVPERFRHPTPKTDVWTPRTVLTAREIGPNNLRTQRVLEVVARVSSGKRPEEVQGEFDAIAARLATEHPSTNVGWGVTVVPLRTVIVGDVDRALVLVLAVVGAILLIVCVNLANMSLARGAGRSREIAIRLSVGASRMRIVRHLLTEPLLLAFVGGALGLALAVWGVQIVLALSAGTLPRVEDVRVDGRVLGFGFLLALITGLMVGLVPAVRATQSKSQDSLKEGRGVVGHGQGVRRVLVVAEVALAVVLVICAGLMARSLLELQRVNPGFDPERVLAVTMQVNLTGVSQPQRHIVQRREAWIQRIGAMPGVVSVGTITGLPLRNQCLDFFEFTRKDGSGAPDGGRLRANYCLASPGYLKAIGIPLLRGAPLPDRGPEGLVPALASEAAAKRFWPGQDPVGQVMRVMAGAAFDYHVMVIGIAGDVRQLGLREEPPPLFYFAQQGFPRLVYTLVIRTTGDPLALGESVRAAIRELDPGQPIRSITLLRDVMWDSIARDRFFTVLFGVFGALALLLAAVGVYGVLSYSVAERTHEMGLRMALGASAVDVMRLVVGAGMRLVFIGVAFGVASALLVTRMLRSQLYGVGTTDWVAFVAAIAVLTIVALLACYVPARRATRVSPTVALRYE